MPDDLRTLRKRLGLTQAQLAALLGVRRATVVDREAGRVPIRPETVFALRYLAEHPELTTGDER